MVLKLHIFNGSAPARAVLITTRALEIDVEIEELTFAKLEQLHPAYLLPYLQHTLPILNDGDLTLWESHAINAYLIGKYAKNDSLYTKNCYERCLIDQRLHFDSGVAQPLLGEIDTAFFNREITEVSPRYKEEINKVYQFVEELLKGHKWVAGNNLTIADFSLIPTITSLDHHEKINSKTYPYISKWIENARKEPCFASDNEQLKHFVDFFKTLKV